MGDVSKASYSKVISNLKNQQIELQKRLYELEMDQQQYWDRLTDFLPKIHDIRGVFEVPDLLCKQQALSYGSMILLSAIANFIEPLI